MRTGLYARVSTNGQGQHPEMQLRELREYCERRGWEIAGEYVDIGISRLEGKTATASTACSPMRTVGASMPS